MLLEILTIITNTAVLLALTPLVFIVGYGIFNYLKIKKKFNHIIFLSKKVKLKMDAEEFLKNENNTRDQNNDQNQVLSDQNETKRERLSAIIAGGGSKQYLGKDLQISDIDKMNSEEINKLYSKYEARLGASMTKTLGNSFINLYVLGISKYFNVIDPPKLIKELNEDPYIDNALNTGCCELYYKFGMYLAPFTAALTTAKYIDFSNKGKDDFSSGKDEVKDNEKDDTES